MEKRLVKMERSQSNLSLDYGFISTVEGRAIKVIFPKDGGKFESDWLLPVSLPGITPEYPRVGQTAVCVIVGNSGVWLGLVQNATNLPTTNTSIVAREIGIEGDTVTVKGDKVNTESTSIATKSDTTQIWKVPGQTLELNSAGLFLNGLRVRTI